MTKTDLPRPAPPVAANGSGAARRILVDIVLWTIATLLMLAAAVYQHETGPTYALQGKFTVQGRELRYKLPRSQGGFGGAPVSIPDPGPGVEGELYYKRFGLDEPPAMLPMQREKGQLYAELPHQPPAGKLEYYLVLRTPAGAVTIPPVKGAPVYVILRFKGDVPVWILLPHILCMFFGMLFGVRTALEVFNPGPRLRRLAWYTLGLLAAGGMFFDSVVQKFAFGQYWTGVPFGWDLTDNKLLLMVLVWIAAVLALGPPRRAIKPLARWTCVIAALVTLAMYAVPHSKFGSTLDYRKVEQGVPQEQAVGQG